MKARAVAGKHVSIDWIVNRISLWAIVATFVFVTIFTIIALLSEIKQAFYREQDRMTVVIPAVARALSSELLIGDDKSVELLSQDLKRQFELSRLDLVDNEDTCTPSVWSVERYFPWLRVCNVIPVREVSTSAFLVISADIKQIGWFSSISTIFWVCIPLILFGIYSTIRIRRDLERSITRPIKELARDPERWDGSRRWVAEEAILLHEQLKSYIRERDLERDRHQSLKLEASVGEIAAQVAHDIRSPLAALDMIASDLRPLPEEKRVLIRSAVSRIRDIANNLVEKHRSARISQGKGTSEVQGAAAATECVKGELHTELLSSLVETLISEKRMQYRARIGLQIDATLTRRSYGLFAAVQPIEFKRVLSNLIDNAAQAVPGTGRVTVDMETDGREVVIRVSDSGQGIPAGLIPKLMQKGASFLKAGGSGLGLYHAKTCIDRWGGGLSIDSKEGEGTVIEIRLPKAPVPRWFVPELRIQGVTNVVILDDDTSIHYIWRGRFESARLKERGVRVLHFSTEAQVEDWYRENKDQVKDSMFLIDYELAAGSKNGLEIIEALSIRENSILVTSRFEEDLIRRICRELSVRVIPKSLAGFVPITV